MVEGSIRRTLNGGWNGVVLIALVLKFIQNSYLSIDYQAMMKKLPPVFRNFYFVSLAIFFAWMLLLDSNNIVARYQLGSKLDALEDEKEYYEEKIREVKQDRSELFGDKESVEKFAREKYLMKKPSEDIYVIIEE